MQSKKLIIIILLFVSLSHFLYMFFNVKMFRHEYEKQTLEQMQELGEIVNKEIEYALQYNIPIESLGGMNPFLQSILDNTPELAYIKIVDSKKVLFSVSREEKGVKKISIPILGAKKQKAQILLGISDTLRKQTIAMLFDLLTIVIAGLIITYEIIRFFASKLVRIPFLESILSINTMIKNLNPYYYAPISIEFRPFLLQLKQKIAERIYQINALCNNLNHISTQLFSKVFYGRELMFNEIKKQKMTLKSLVTDKYEFKRIIDPSQIRPIVFIFFLSANLQSSFLPIFSRELLLQPTILSGLFSEEILIALPITCYMIGVTITMLLLGSKLFQGIRQNYAIGFGTICTSAGLIACGFAQDIIQLILARTVCAIGFAFIVIYCKKYIVDHSSEKNRGVYLAGFTAAFSGGLLCSIVIGSIMVDYFSYRFVFFAAAIIILVILFFDYLILSEDESTDIKAMNDDSFGVINFFKVGIYDKNLICIMLHGILTRITFIGFFYYSLPLILKPDFAYADIGRMMMFYGVPSILFASYLNKKIKESKQSKFYIGYVNLILGLFFIFFNFMITGSLFFKAGSIIIILLVLGVANSITFPTQSSLLLSTKTAKIAGTRTTLSIYNSSERIGSGLGPIIYGFFASCYDINKAVVVGGIVCVVGNILFLLFFFPDTQNDSVN